MMVLPMGPWGGGAATAYSIANSLLFRGGQKMYRSFTSSATWGMSVWIRRGALNVVSPILGNAVKFNANNTLTAGSLTTAAVYRDPTAWLHIAVAAGRLYVNGVDMGATTTSAFTCSSTNCLGYDGANYLNGYVAEFVFTDGSQPSSAPGHIDGATGSWGPDAVSVAVGTNGAYLGKPWSSASLGADYSGQGNNWTPSGFSANDALLDSPSSVYAALSPFGNDLYTVSGVAPVSLDGNLKFYQGNTTQWGTGRSLFVLPGYGLYYFEMTVSASGGGGGVGVFPVGTILASAVGNSRVGNYSGGVAYNANGQKEISGALTSYGSAWSDGTVVSVAIDQTNDAIYFAKDGVWQNSGIPTSGISKTGAAATSGISNTLLTAAVNTYYGGIYEFNFGQRSFVYAPPTGFKSICTANMPATTGAASGSFTGNGSSDGPTVYTGAVPATITVNGNAVTWGTHADKLAIGFKLRTSSSSYNSTGSNAWSATYSTPQKPTVGANNVPSNAQGNP